MFSKYSENRLEPIDQIESKQTFNLLHKSEHHGTWITGNESRTIFYEKMQLWLYSIFTFSHFIYVICLFERSVCVFVTCKRTSCAQRIAVDSSSRLHGLSIQIGIVYCRKVRPLLSLCVVLFASLFRFLMCDFALANAYPFPKRLHYTACNAKIKLAHKHPALCWST